MLKELRLNRSSFFIYDMKKDVMTITKCKLKKQTGFSAAYFCSKSNKTTVE